MFILLDLLNMYALSSAKEIKFCFWGMNANISALPTENVTSGVLVCRTKLGFSSVKHSQCIGMYVAK